MNKLIFLLTLTSLLIVAGCSGTQDTVIGPDIADQQSTDSMDAGIQKSAIGPDPWGDPWDDKKYRGRPWFNPPQTNPWDTLLSPVSPPSDTL